MTSGAVQHDFLLAAQPSFDLTFIQHMKLAGHEFRAQRWRDLVSPDWFQSDFYRDHHAAQQIADAVYVGFPLSGSCESVLAFCAPPWIIDD